MKKQKVELIFIFGTIRQPNHGIFREVNRSMTEVVEPIYIFTQKVTQKNKFILFLFNQIIVNNIQAFYAAQLDSTWFDYYDSEFHETATVKIDSSMKGKKMRYLTN